MPAHAALQYSPDGFDTRVGKMMGRQVAGEAFVRAWVQYAGADPVTGFVHSTEHADAFRRHVAEHGPQGAVTLASPSVFEPLQAAGALWIGDPVLGLHAWRRRMVRQDAWSLVGITHTLSTSSALDAIGSLLTAPVQPWDALICTSRAAQAAVLTVLQDQADYLGARLGAAVA